MARLRRGNPHTQPIRRVERAQRPQDAPSARVSTGTRRGTWHVVTCTADFRLRGHAQVGEVWSAARRRTSVAVGRDPVVALKGDGTLWAWGLNNHWPRRIRRSDNERHVVHVQRLTPRQVTWWEQMPIVTPATAIEQCLEYGTPTYLLHQALDRGARTGAVLRDDLNRLTEALERRG
jgi:hypothetical protein